MQPAMNGHQLDGWQSALYSSLSRPLWACSLAWIVFACLSKRNDNNNYNRRDRKQHQTSSASSGTLLNPFRLAQAVLEAKCFIPLSRLTYAAFLIHPIVMAVFYGSRQNAFNFSHYLMLYLILGNIVITYACAFILATLFELPLISIERLLSRRLLFSSTTSVGSS